MTTTDQQRSTRYRASVKDRALDLLRQRPHRTSELVRLTGSSAVSRRLWECNRQGWVLQNRPLPQTDDHLWVLLAEPGEPQPRLL